MSYLLDTCSFLWLCQEPNKIPRTVRLTLEETSNDLYLSLVSVWEMALKESLGQLHFVKPLDELVHSAHNEFGIELLNLKVSACGMLRKLPTIHRDPFDRMLICQAIVEGLTLVTPDPDITEYPVEVIW